MARDIDRLIEHVQGVEYLPPVMRRVVVNRLDPAPTSEELERAEAEVYGRPDGRQPDSGT